MKEIATSSVFLSKGSMKTISPPLLDNMTELEVFTDASSSVQANVYVDQSLFKSPQGQDLGIQEPALVIPLMPPESKLSFKTLATVEQPGFVRIRLLEGLVVDISIDLDVRLYNPQHRTAVSVSESGEKVAVIHPTGRARFHPCSIEVQCDDHVSLKKAKIEPGVVSFTGSNLSEVYLLTDMGVTTSLEEIQQNLYVTDHVESQFSAAIKTSFFPSTSSLFFPRTMLDNFRFETTGSGENQLQIRRLDWIFGELIIQQDQEGFVVVELTKAGVKTVLKSNPNTGELNLETPNAQLSASLGESGEFSVMSKMGGISYTTTTRTLIASSENGKTSGLDTEGVLMEN